MTRDYKKKRTQKKDTGVKPGSAFAAGLVMGICLTIAVYFAVQQQSTIETPTEITSVAKTEASLTELDEQSQADDSIAPTFEFYKILPDMELNVSEWESEEPATEKTAQAEVVAQNRQAGFVLQLGSFRSFESADQVKAKLALLGIDADIQQVVINGNNVFHRVRVGPYNTTGKLEEAQERLLANDLNFSVLKLSIDDI